MSRRSALVTPAGLQERAFHEPCNAYAKTSSKRRTCAEGRRCRSARSPGCCPRSRGAAVAERGAAGRLRRRAHRPRRGEPTEDASVSARPERSTGSKHRLAPSHAGALAILRSISDATPRTAKSATR